MAEGLGFEPSHNGFRDRRATATLALSMCGRDRGIRTLTGRILSPLSLPVGLYPHRGVLGTGRHPWIVYYHFANSYLRQLITVVLNLY